LPVDPRRNWDAVFRSLGYRPGFRYEKFRTSFRLKRPHLDLDETPVGIFLEIEGTPGAIDRVACALGYSRQDYIRATYWDLHAAEYRRRGQIPRNMLFHG
jgi:adenylate cyclase, class 2